MRTTVLLVYGASLIAAETVKSPKPVDLCSPPPGATAPSLPAKLLQGQGTVSFPISTQNAEAQKFFDQGVAQMHSFWAREAERSFLQAAELDPTAPMPQWGIAMVAAGDFRPAFQLDAAELFFGKAARSENRATKAARKALELSQVPGKANDREKLYIALIVARRDLRAKDPDADYVRGLRALLDRYPNEVEAKSYLALALMRGFTLPEHQPKLTSMESVKLLRELLVQAPEHPGVHHFVIHGFEGSSFAKEAWPSCQRYAELVPNIPHALHMPGHIYSQTGKWNEAVASFSAAADNERSYMQADTLYGNGHHGHNVHYLAAAYSFRGDTEKAMEAARHLMTYKETPREAARVDDTYITYRQGWFALMRTLVQAGRWEQLVDGQTLPSVTKPRLQAWNHWARAIAFVNLNRPADARQEAGAMEAALKELQEKTKRRTPEELLVARAELRGHLDIANGRVRTGLSKLAKVSAAERRLRYIEPPHYPRPVAEAWGKSALRAGQMAIARAAFETALQQYPADHWAEQGLEQVSRPGTSDH